MELDQPGPAIELPMDRPLFLPPFKPKIAADLAAALRGEIRLLYVAPERFHVPGFSEALERARPVLLAIDEAHCIVEWGRDFRPDYARLGEVVQRLEPPRVVALTATATPDVRDQIGKQRGLANPAVFVRGFDRPNFRLSVVPVRGDKEKLERCVAREQALAGVEEAVELREGVVAERVLRVERDEPRAELIVEVVGAVTLESMLWCRVRMR